MLQKLENELKVHKVELQAAKETIKRLTNEKSALEQKLSEFEKQKADEVI